MARVRPRDIRAIVFCVVVIPAFFLIAMMVLDNWLYGTICGALFAVWLLTRARMLRIYRRLRGEAVGGWENYYSE